MRGVIWLNAMIAWICNSFFLASDWAVQNNELMTALTCYKMGHLTSLIGCPGARRVAGRTAYFGILLAMIADGSPCCLMSDGNATSDID